MVSATAFAVAAEASPPVEAHRGIGDRLSRLFAAPSNTAPRWSKPPFATRLRMSPMDNRPNVHWHHHCAPLIKTAALAIDAGRGDPVQRFASFRLFPFGAQHLDTARDPSA